jgi:hypothetical protein
VSCPPSFLSCCPPFSYDHTLSTPSSPPHRFSPISLFPNVSHHLCLSLSLSHHSSPPIVAGVKMSPLAPPQYPRIPTSCGLSISFSLKFPCSPRPSWAGGPVLRVLDSGGYIEQRTKGVGGGEMLGEDFPSTAAAAAVKHRQTLNSRIAVKTARHLLLPTGFTAQHNCIIIT